jgi:hypothetical protein
MNAHIINSNRNFDAVADGSKTFEVAKDNGDFAAGDLLIIQETANKAPTGRVAIRLIGFVLRGFKGLADGYAVLGLTPFTSVNTGEVSLV